MSGSHKQYFTIITVANFGGDENNWQFYTALITASEYDRCFMCREMIPSKSCMTLIIVIPRFYVVLVISRSQSASQSVISKNSIYTKVD